MTITARLRQHGPGSISQCAGAAPSRRGSLQHRAPNHRPRDVSNPGSIECEITSKPLELVGLLLIINKATGGYYSFNNIPYAEPPLADLRFRLPVPLVTVNRTVNDGTNARVCYQQSAPWFQFSVPLVIQTIMNGGITVPPSGPSPPVTGQSEDCLLLDVSVPKDVFDAQAAGALTSPIPVIVWIHGGGYIEGSKQGFNPAGLIAQSRRKGAKGIIFVAIQYRLYVTKKKNLLATCVYESLCC
jgi:hypothetical protein